MKTLSVITFVSEGYLTLRILQLRPLAPRRWSGYVPPKRASSRDYDVITHAQTIMIMVSSLFHLVTLRIRQFSIANYRKLESTILEKPQMA
jgi:hypothetical protein